MLDYKGYIFDLDGTIYLGKNAIEGAADTVNALLEKGKRVVFLTNKTIDSREVCLRKLQGFGIPVDLDQIISPAVVTLDLLRNQYPNKRVYVIGESIFKEELLREGVLFAETPEETDVVLLSWDRDFHYNHLNFAFKAIKKGAVVIATNPDRTCPMPDGELPDCGAIIGAVEGATGQKIDLITGKPSKHMADTALRALQLAPEDCLMIGDRLETDVYMGILSGMDSALVLTGATRREAVASSSHTPSYVIHSVNDLIS